MRKRVTALISVASKKKFFFAHQRKSSRQCSSTTSLSGSRATSALVAQKKGPLKESAA